jgi:hypothetical protein
MYIIPNSIQLKFINITFKVRKVFMKKIIILFLVTGCLLGLEYQSILPFSETLSFGAKCPTCEGQLGYCYRCGAHLRCNSCAHCWGCGKNGW